MEPQIRFCTSATMGEGNPLVEFRPWESSIDQGWEYTSSHASRLLQRREAQ